MAEYFLQRVGGKKNTTLFTTVDDCFYPLSLSVVATLGWVSTEDAFNLSGRKLVEQRSIPAKDRMRRIGKC